MDEYEVNQPIINFNPHYTWIVTTPTGQEFEIANSEWFMETYYGNVPGWSYRRVQGE